MANAPAAMTVSPAASPSSPSVRFTAFELAVVTNVTNGEIHRPWQNQHDVLEERQLRRRGRGARS